MSNDLPLQPESREVRLNLPSVQPNGVELGFAGSGPPAGESTPVSGLKRPLNALMRYKWVVLLVTLVGTGIGLVASRIARPTYVVQSTIWIDPGGRGPIPDPQLLNSTQWNELLRSFAVLDHVVNSQRLYLVNEPGDQALFVNFSLKERFRVGEYRVRASADGRVLTLETNAGLPVGTAAPGDSLGQSLGFRWVPRAGSLAPGRVVRFTVRPPRDVARELIREINSRLQQRGGSFMHLELRGRDRSRLAPTLNAVIDRFVDLAAELKRVRLQENATTLVDQLAAAQRNLENAEIALSTFQIETITKPAQTGAPGQSGTQGAVSASFMALKLQQDQIRQDRAAIARAIERAQDSTISIAQLEVIGAVQGSSELKTALAELSTKRSAMRAMQYHYTDEYAPARRLRTEIETLEREAVPQLISALMIELDRRDTQVEAQLSRVSDELREVPPRVMEEARLKRNVAIADNLSGLLRQRLEEARLAALSSRPDLRIVDRARVPRSPVQDLRKQILLLGFAMSLGLAVGGVILFDRFDPRVRYPDQVTRGLRLPILAAVPRLKARNGMALRDENTAQVIEAFRALRLKLLHDLDGGRLVTTITSPGSGDGKSFVTINLALAFADQGYRTLVIDGDIRRGGLHRLVAGTRKPGLTDVLAGTAQGAAAIQKTGHENLDLIACGTRLHAGPELLGSRALYQLIQDLRETYAVILIDSPPLGAGVDPFVLGATVGNVAIVLRAGLTDREFAEAKLGVLDGLPVRVLGAILNGVPSGGEYRYYSYLTGYESNNETASVDDGARVPVLS
jgi:tyrosine-protein kinase Etk/Wzc